jgi:hypothetical protein
MIKVLWSVQHGGRRVLKVYLTSRSSQQPEVLPNMSNIQMHHQEMALDAQCGGFESQKSSRRHETAPTKMKEKKWSMVGGGLLSTSALRPY